jgi:hypothetical protein
MTKKSDLVNAYAFPETIMESQHYLDKYFVTDQEYSECRNSLMSTIFNLDSTFPDYIFKNNSILAVKGGILFTPTEIESLKKCMKHTGDKYFFVIEDFNEFFYDSVLGRRLSIGECNIRLIGFERKSDDLAVMHYGVFVNDSVPATDPYRQTNMGKMFTGFNVDSRQKKLLSGTDGALGFVKFGNIRQLHDSALRSKQFKEYIIKHRANMHPKFSRVLPKGIINN